MGDEWRTDEPEVGQLLRLKDFDRIWMYHGKEGLYFFVCGELSISDIKVPEWQPITTPEEQRLRAEVERLREENGKLKRLVGFFEKNKAGGTVLPFVDGAIETEAGGADYGN